VESGTNTATLAKFYLKVVASKGADPAALYSGPV